MCREWVADAYCFVVDIVCFFFSSRRRHTRWPRDWSSDVCSSDLTLEEDSTRVITTSPRPVAGSSRGLLRETTPVAIRSEERRVGKDCRSLRTTDHTKRKTTET